MTHEHAVMENYNIDKALIHEWQRRTRLTWDNKRAEAMLYVLGFPVGCNPQAYLRMLKRTCDKVRTLGADFDDREYRALNGRTQAARRRI